MGNNPENNQNDKQEDPNREPAGYDKFGEPYYYPTEHWHVVQSSKPRRRPTIISIESEDDSESEEDK